MLTLRTVSFDCPVCGSTSVLKFNNEPDEQAIERHSLDHRPPETMNHGPQLTAIYDPGGNAVIWHPKKQIKVWHDDIRQPPSCEWHWARTNAEARELFGAYDVTEISLDHDLGFHDADPDAPGAAFLRGQSEETGLDLVDWMNFHDLVPDKVTIHSWNPSGADRMRRSILAKNFRRARGPVYPRVEPYRAP